MQSRLLRLKREWILRMLNLSQLESLKNRALEYCEGRDQRTTEYLEGRGISSQTADNKWLGTIINNHPGHEGHQGWLSIPYVTLSGTVAGYKFRRLDDGLPKYGSPTGQKTHLYNVTDIDKDSDTLVVCEGELDTIVCSELLEIPAVGCPGVASWKPHYVKMLEGYKSILVVGDNDLKDDGSNPGQDFAKRVAGELQNTTIILLPAGMDITDCYLQEGKERTRERLGFQWNNNE